MGSLLYIAMLLNHLLYWWFFPYSSLPSSTSASTVWFLCRASLSVRMKQHRSWLYNCVHDSPILVLWLSLLWLSYHLWLSYMAVMFYGYHFMVNMFYDYLCPTVFLLAPRLIFQPYIKLLKAFKLLKHIICVNELWNLF